MTDKAININKMLKQTKTEDVDFVVDGVHFGRGDFYSDESSETKLKHRTLEVKSWKINNKNLEQVEEQLINRLCSNECYIIQWNVLTELLDFKSEEPYNTNKTSIFFYWKGENATKGFSPLPEPIEKENPPVERIVQWAEPPAFLRLFSRNLIVHNGKKGPHLYILRGEIDNEAHLYELELKKENLRSRTSFVVHVAKKQLIYIWNGGKASSNCRRMIKQVAEKNFTSCKLVEIEEGREGEEFRVLFGKEEDDYFVCPTSRIIDYTPRLFYFNQINGNFSVVEVECSHRSSHLSAFPFLQSHLYTADQPAIFLLDDNDELWLWHGWEQEETFKTDCFMAALGYAKEKSKKLERLVKVQKVIAGYEPAAFTNLFPAWRRREDIAKIQEKNGVLPHLEHALIEVISDGN